ncbi:MAG: hypothetical protein IM329_10945 [Microcystis sp. M112S1]|nr:hypothetical protein [Microcystis sp. M112S1]
MILSHDIAKIMDDANTFLAKPITTDWYKLPVSDRLHLLDHPEEITNPTQRTFIMRREIATEMLRIEGEPEFEQRTVIRLIMQALRMHGWEETRRRIGYDAANFCHHGLRRP